MELVAFLAVGLVLGAAAIYSDIFEPAQTASLPPATLVSMPAAVIVPEVAAQIILPAEQPTLAVLNEVSVIQTAPVSPEPSVQLSRTERHVSTRAQQSRNAARIAADQTDTQNVQQSSRPRARTISAQRRPSRQETSHHAPTPSVAQAPLEDPAPRPFFVVPQHYQIAQAPARARPVSRNGTPIYAAETPEGLMDLACFELISGERSFVGPENGAFLNKFDIERVAVTCRYGALEGPATYVLTPNRVYGYNGTVWANVWRMLPQNVRELRVRFEGRDTPVTDRRSRSPRRASVWDGDAVGFDPQGRVLLMARFTQGNFDGPLQVRSPNGVTIFSGAYKALPEGGVPHGMFTLANQSGRVVARRFFCNGYPVGVHQFYSTRGDTIGREDYRPMQRDVGECPWINEGESSASRRR